MTRIKPAKAFYRIISLQLPLIILLWTSSTLYAAQWSIETVDSSGNVGQYASLAAWNGRLHLSYFDVSNGALKYATKPIDGAWTLQTIDKSATTGLHTSISAGNFVHISYYKETSSQLMYASNETGKWGHKAVDSAQVVGQYSAIVVDRNEKSHISYYDKSNHSLNYAHNMNGSWVKETVDTDAQPGNVWRPAAVAVESGNRSKGQAGDVGSYSSITIDSRSRIHISYYDITNGHLKYAMKDSTGWHISTIDEGCDKGSYSAIAIDFADNIHLSYVNAGSGTLKYATKSPAGDWQLTTVDPSSFVQGHTSIAADSAGHLHISYYSFASNDGDLRYATNASGSWVLETIDRSGGDTENVGKYTSIAVDADRNPHITYYDTTNGDLKYAFRKNPAIAATPAVLDFGTVAFGSQSSQRTVSVSNSGKGNLLIGQLSVTGPQSAAFIVIYDHCTGQPLLPQGICTVKLAFAPATTGRSAAALQIRSDDPAVPLLAVAMTGSGGATHTITVAPGAGGTITPMASVTLPEGGSQRFSFTPAQNFYIYDVLVDHISVGRPGDYLFSNVTSDHLIETVFHSHVRVVTGLAVYYGSIQEALDAAPNGSGIQTQNAAGAGSTGNFALKRDVIVKLQGGFDNDYATQTGMTTIIGTLEISSGGMEVENLEIR